MVTSTPEPIDQRRRQVIGAAAISFAAIELGINMPARAVAAAPAAQNSFGPLKQVDAGVLNVGYAEAGPADGAPVILLHGWPYDIHTYVDAAPLLAAKGFRVIVPYLRGYGATRFLASETPRNGQQSAIAMDVVALMDAPITRLRKSCE
jgi:hypothetical protein